MPVIVACNVCVQNKQLQSQRVDSAVSQSFAVTMVNALMRHWLVIAIMIVAMALTNTTAVCIIIFHDK